MTPDPIFEKAAKYKAAWESFRTNDEPVDANGRIHVETPEYRAWRNAEDRLNDLLCDAEDNLISTQPRTRAGAAAMVRAYLDVSRGLDMSFIALLKSLLAYLESADA
jgi:hypothetical protein